MSSRITGSGAAHRYKVENEFDPQYGDVFVEYWNGPRAPIQALAAGYKAAGAKVSVTHVGPKYEMTVRLGGNTSNNPGQSPIEIPVDQWSIDMEPVQRSIWAHPYVEAQMAAYANQALYRKDIEDAIKDGTVLPAPINTDVVAEGIYLLLARGVDSYEVKRPVLTKTRTYSTVYADRFVLDAAEKVFTTSALISAMNIPAAVQRQLPANPSTTATGCAWAWKVRTDRTQLIPALGKIQETRDWVFDMWSIDNAPTSFGLYTLVS